jgi:hypothetical protein
VAAKPLDVSQTASSTHWQYPPKRPSANAHSIGDLSEIVIAAEIILAPFPILEAPREKGTAEAAPRIAA